MLAFWFGFAIGVLKGAVGAAVILKGCQKTGFVPYARLRAAEGRFREATADEVRRIEEANRNWLYNLDRADRPADWDL